jgi:hypothetical protein
VEVSNLSNNRVVRTPTFGHFHQSVKVGLGPWWLALDNGGYIHFLHWKWHKLLVRTMKQSHIKWPETFPAVKTRLPDCTRYDPHRFIAGVKVVLSVAVDTFGQVAVIDASDRVICMFFAFQKNVAAWMPDGTRFGPASLTGGPPSPNAAEVIGRALAEAAGIRRPES